MARGMREWIINRETEASKAGSEQRRRRQAKSESILRAWNAITRKNFSGKMSARDCQSI